jgi:competence ComEA-like helix-hairpin-helix protein
MRWKEYVRDYFSYSRRERLGLLTLLVMIVCVFLLPTLVNNSGGDQKVLADTAWIAAMKRLTARKNDTQLTIATGAAEKSRQTAFSPPSPELFYFDPNELDEMGWQKLGVRQKTAETIIRFRSKGGRFYRAADLQKIYGLRKTDIDRLTPYVRFRRKEEAQPEYRKDPVNPKAERVTIVDINRADTSSFISLPGIGSKLAARIVSFREKLGGFYSISQVSETFGLADSVFQKIRPYLALGDPTVKKININTASLEELKSHPYIRFALGKAMIAYRNEHGPFTALDDLKKIMAVTVELYNRIVPYLFIQ